MSLDLESIFSLLIEHSISIDDLEFSHVFEHFYFSLKSICNEEVIRIEEGDILPDRVLYCSIVAPSGSEILCVLDQLYIFFWVFCHQGSNNIYSRITRAIIDDDDLPIESCLKLKNTQKTL